MLSKRLIAVFSLWGCHAALVASGGALPDKVAPAIAGTVYLPLYLLGITGIPVFGRAESSGWAGPSILGWFLAGLLWALLWWLFVAAITKVRAR
jgi:hypothetical protein